jgi:ABC-2 type transport system ATP-binding protein
MKQRLKLAQALVHDPRILFLDEPTSNLDPHGRTEILELIRDISSKKGIQVLLCSHILSDIESICVYVVILNKGQVAAQGDIQELKEINYRLFELKIKGESEDFVKKLRDLGCRVEETEDKILKIYMPADQDKMRIFEVARQTQVQVRQFVRSQTSLEDLFARAVGVD